ncbi:hypothetical protein M8C21_022306 [Ambrosia artemisiifolia]|uniref:DUF7815 domain-containing protein n=1 Tax=Ambrosia artemisiifolia TaxID=4212 RepID=A0AAD5BY76_AMBAR|nr:hypothetical protein M8C21_022306 [Ambrosia artemisiifolia]
MDFDIPSDLINQAQIGFKQSIGLSSFDPNNTTYPSISTVESLISSLDPSPPYLRCKYCQAKLIRGLQSLICIYCGQYHNKDLPPDPISFSSTHGYTWLLQSLNFNGSERVGSLAEVNGGQSPAEDELTLSELLDLKITWREPEKPENSINTTTSEHNSSLNLGSTDFDNFFAKPVSNTTIISDVIEEKSVASKVDQNKIVEGQESSTSDWNAEFQFADTKKESQKPESVDLFKGAEADLSAHMDVAFGQTESLDFKKPDNDSDMFQDDLFVNMSSKTFQQNDQLDSVLQAKDGLSGDRNIKDADEDWFSDGNWQKSSVKNTLNDVSLQDNANDSSTAWFENTNWQKSSTDNTAAVTDSLFDIKPYVNDMIPSKQSDIVNSDKPNLDDTDWFQNTQLATGGSSSTINVMATKDDGDDGFGEWNDFASSTGNQNSVQDFWKESGTEKADYGTSEKMSELNFFQPTVDSKEVDFGNFLQSDMFSGDKNPTDTQTVYDIFSEVPTRSRNANTEARDDAEGSNNDRLTPNATTSPKDDVQMLMSQMHDLSFMLKNELSVPSKPDDIGTSHS